MHPERPDADGSSAPLKGSARTRFGVFAAGTASAEEPKHTVVPQRERVERGQQGAGAGGA